jgi:hypothetical protein
LRGLTGEQPEEDLRGELPASREIVWAELNDPEVLKTCIPGCEELEKTDEYSFRAVAPRVPMARTPSRRCLRPAGSKATKTISVVPTTSSLNRDGSILGSDDWAGAIYRIS